MSNLFVNIAAATLVLGFMILIHEWGHFIAAKFFGVRVNVFSIGFGPRLFGWRRGTTDYRLSALPFGGYVKMEGESPVEERTGAADEFLSKPRWQRVAIAVAGPIMNILLAVLIMFGLFLAGGAPEPAFLTRPVKLAGVLADSTAARAGLRAGDVITEINGTRNPRWEEAPFALAMSPPGAPIHVAIDRDGQKINLLLPSIKPQDAADQLDQILGYPQQPVFIAAVGAGTPAAKGGMQTGDEVAQANGKELVNPVQFTTMIRESQGQTIALVVRRNGAELPLTVTPAFGDPGDGAKRWQIGVSVSPGSLYRSHSLPDALRRATKFNVQQSEQIVQVLGGLFQGRVSLKQLSGPAGIAPALGQAARRGPVDLLFLTAIISLNLGILNLLPIPILDGGHVLLLAIESILRRDLSVALKERFVQVSLVFLLSVIVLVTYFDVVKLLPGH